MKISRANGINEDIKEQYEITIYDCHNKPIFKSDNLNEAALFYVTHITAHDYKVEPYSIKHDFSSCMDNTIEELGNIGFNTLIWGIDVDSLYIYSCHTDDDIYFPYSRLKKLVEPDNIEDYTLNNDVYKFKKDTLACNKVSKVILDIIKKESKDYNV